MRPVSTVATRTGTFAYVDAGPPGGPVVLCLHGFPDTPNGFGPLLGILARAGLRPVAPWSRGYAPSQPEGPYDPGQLGMDVVALADALSPRRRVALVGHDWGAVAAIAAAARAPERFRAVVALAVPHPASFLRALRSPRQLRRSWYMLLFQLPGVSERLLAALDFALVDRLWRAWSPGWSPPADHLAEVKHCLAASLPAPLRYYRALARRIALTRPMDPPRIRVPTLRLHGERDGCIGVEIAADEARLYDGPFRREVISGVGHFLHLERPDEVGARIVRWLEEEDGRDAATGRGL